ncbi:bi-domain-containing oxidoreductase [Verrucomicrobia bacterium]|nr:bi-domain-containing oxidoreductase [Verrucomicrobiota bacterium]
MKQLLQDLRNGETQVVEVPCPVVRSGSLLIRTVSSLVSIGTEGMLIRFGKANLFDKARQQPEKVRQVIEKVKTDGLANTLNAVKAKLDQSIPLGYCNVGCVISTGEGVDGFEKGDLVLTNGPHAEMVCVPKNLVAGVPEGLKAEEACFAVLGSIGLQGIRLLKPTIGECFVVTGLGLIGLLAVQILRANGCRVIGIDLDSSKCDLARQFGAEAVDLSAGEDPLSVSQDATKGLGVDGVLITASTTSNDPVHQGAQMCRKRGRILLVGVTGLELSRSDFYEKELSFQVSCSYGPGRYDPNYEENGQDYPFGFVRWTEQRNFEAVLGLMESGKIDVKPLISHRFEFGDALRAYDQATSRGSLGIVLNYGRGSEGGKIGALTRSMDLRSPASDSPTKSVVGLIGAGGFTKQVLLPALAQTGTRLKTIVSFNGVSGTQLGQKFGVECSSTDSKSVFGDGEIDIVVVTTRHDTHARLVMKALEAGKRVYVEKPLCLKLEELDQITGCYRGLVERGESPFVMVGFNRRFAPQIVQIKVLLARTTEPKAMTMIVNAGLIPNDHWTQDRSVGGGRIVGEACHFIDLLRFLAGSPISGVQIAKCQAPGSAGKGDTLTVLLSFEDGSTGTIQYLSNGHKGVSKERLDVYCGGKVVSLDNFRKLTGYGWKGFKNMNLWRQDKGHAAEMAALIDAVTEGKPSPIPFEEIVEVTRASFQAAGILTTDNSDCTDQ